LRPGAPGFARLLGLGCLCAFLGFGRTLRFGGVPLRGGLLRRDVRALFRDRGGFFANFCVRHAIILFCAASRMTIHHSSSGKQQGKSACDYAFGTGRLAGMAPFLKTRQNEVGR